MNSQNQCQKYNTFLSTQQSYHTKSNNMRQFIDSKPDAQEHFNRIINNQNVEITFRYYSPEKIRHSSINSHQAICSGQTESIISSRKIDTAEQQIRQKVSHAPQLYSDKFYQDKIEKIPHSMLTIYENFQQKLLNKHLLRQDFNKNKSIKIKLTKDNLSIQKSPSQKNNKKYIKNVHINLDKQSKLILTNFMQEQNSKIYSEKNKNISQLNNKSFEKSHNKNIMTQKFEAIKRNKYKIKIKLYENTQRINEKQIQQEQENFKTPRRKNNSNKKGIIVYSSSKYKNKSQSLEKNINYKQNSQFLVSECQNIKIKNNSLKTMTRKNSKIQKTFHEKDNLKTANRKRAFSKQKLQQTRNPFENSKSPKISINTIKK